MANSNDGTTLNPGVGGDVYSSEDQPVGSQRGDPNLPLTDYKVARSKIAVGPYDTDAGDATFQNPLPVESRRERQAAELAFLKSADAQRYSFSTRSRERVNLQFMNRGER